MGDTAIETRLSELGTKLEELTGKAQSLVQRLESDPSAADQIKADLKSIQDQVQPLLRERDERLRDLELRDMKAQVQTLEQTLEEFRSFNPEAGRKASGSDNPYDSGEASFFADLARSRRGDRKAMERLEEGTKAMTEGTDSAGGYLVTPELSRQLLELRLDKTPVLGVIPSLRVNSDKLEFIEQTGGLTAGWVAELTEKPSADMTFGQLEVSVFTAAGLAVASNQLLQDAGKTPRGVSMSLDSLIVRELARRLAILESRAIWNGSGTGQPLGILNTSGVGNAGGALTSTQVVDLLDKIVDAIGEVQDQFKSDPTLIAMHPRTWARIVKAREASAPSTYLIGAGSTAFGRRANDPIPGGVKRQGIVGELFGYPVLLDANIPTNLGAGSNESRVVVGAFDEALILDRQGVTVDTSEHVYFTSNQTVFRAEMRVGFTAARYPEAFSVISGAGLANG